ncbi:thioesterase II family protein [Burkholderia ubonensis]|uniref:Thioesterase domain-containing protein n=1 Tax=Burkholderia ubonensis subsp. mesacidophila TaxID=265293 RepID=A0A2A4FM39_9BURK|nr:alpha/beta fold hydrolase [Burkholderia ubonensis]PCE33694.1 hypothetical protein BZL54_04100 [Burkholderia ubonensis subsp. mesacidophila]
MNNIYLLPYAGGSVSNYRSYVEAFPDQAGRVVAVEIPGRGKRSHEPFAHSIPECAALTVEQIDTTSGDYIIHGHCMGALLAFEVIKLLEAREQRLPRFMVASGRNAPKYATTWSRHVEGLDDRRFFDALQEIGGVPRGLNFAMSRQFLTIIRADQKMSRDYDPGNTKINVPVLALAGRDDDMTNAAALEEWRDYTSGAVAVKWLDGQHYFIFDQASQVASCIEAFDKLVDR